MGLTSTLKRLAKAAPIIIAAAPAAIDTAKAIRKAIRKRRPQVAPAAELPAARQPDRTRRGGA